MHPPLSLIIVNYGTSQLVLNLLESVAQHSDVALLREVVIVDNGFPERGDTSDHVSPSAFAFPIRFVQNSSASYASGVNRGIGVSSGPLVVVANSDVEWLPTSSITPICAALEDPAVGVVGPQLVFPDGRWQRSCGPFPSLGQALRNVLLAENIANAVASWRHATRPTPPGIRRVDYVDGAFMIIRRTCFDTVGGFDEAFTFYAEDADFCWRAREHGWITQFVPTFSVMHLRGASSRALAPLCFSKRLFASRIAFVERHFGRTRAHWYAHTQRVALIELSLLYRAAAFVRRSSSLRDRAAAARRAAEAAAAAIQTIS
jgi:GT2 family glycosyltransferase